MTTNGQSTIAIRCNYQACRDLFAEWHKTYSDDPTTSNEFEPFIASGVRHFQKLYQNGTITEAEFGLIIDCIACW